MPQAVALRPLQQLQWNHGDDHVGGTDAEGSGNNGSIRFDLFKMFKVVNHSLKGQVL